MSNQHATNNSNPLEKYINDVGSGPTHYVALTFRDEEDMEQYGDVVGCMRVEDYDALADMVTETPIQISRKAHNVGMVLIPGEFPPEEGNSDWITMPDVITVWKEYDYLLFKAEYKGVAFIGHGDEVGPFEECDNTGFNIAPGIYPKDLHNTADYAEHKTRWDEYAAIANAISDVDNYIPSKYVKKAFSKTLK